jgi:hypothetical protein
MPAFEAAAGKEPPMMPRRALRRAAAALALATLALLAPSPGHALPGTLFERVTAATLSPLLHRLHDFFGRRPAVTSKSGSSLDPNGATAESGSKLDPNGATTAGESGASLDPDGGF